MFDGVGLAGSMVFDSVGLAGSMVFDSVGLAGFKSKVNAFLLAELLAHFLSPTVFPFSSLILWVGVVWLGSSD